MRERTTWTYAAPARNRLRLPRYVTSILGIPVYVDHEIEPGHLVLIQREGKKVTIELGEASK